MCTPSTVADGAALNVALSEVPLFVKYTGTTSVKNGTHSALKNGFRGPGVIHVVNGMMTNGGNVLQSENKLYTVAGKSVDIVLFRNQVTRRSIVAIPDGVYIYVDGGRK